LASQSLRSAEPAERFQTESVPDGRTPWQRDRDRVLYCGAFARLAETTQVLSPSLGHVIHNRLTHSLKVGQIARRIAERLLANNPATVERLGGLDAEAAEAAGFSHDLGHPPFGHIAEEELDTLVREAGVDDGYEGNAQSFRIVTRLASSDAWRQGEGARSGLNLTRLTLDGILKYPWTHGQNPEKTKKWGAYHSEQEIFEWVRKGRSGFRQSLTAEVMDWADDITFAIHDLLDFYCAGKIPIERFKAPGSVQRKRLTSGMFRRMPSWKEAEKDYLESLDQLVYRFPFDTDHVFGNSQWEQSRLHHFATGLIRRFVESFTVRAAGVSIEPSARREVEVLKQFTWEYVIENPDLAVVQSGQRHAIRAVFTWLLKQAQDKQDHRVPPAFRDSVRQAQGDRNAIVRSVCDCVAGMTERQVLRMHASLKGREMGHG